MKKTIFITIALCSMTGFKQSRAVDDQVSEEINCQDLKERYAKLTINEQINLHKCQIGDLTVYLLDGSRSKSETEKAIANHNAAIADLEKQLAVK